MTVTTMNADADHRGAEAAPDLFDDWFDPIDAGLRARARGFIETMLETELDAALAHPRYGRHRVERDAEVVGVADHRHGDRTRTLTGTFGATEITAPRARLGAGDGAALRAIALAAYDLASGIPERRYWRCGCTWLRAASDFAAAEPQGA